MTSIHAHGTPDQYKSALYTGTTYKETATGQVRLSISITVAGEYITALEKYAKQQNFNLKAGVKELIEEGLIREGALPKWWRAREFDS